MCGLFILQINHACAITVLIITKIMIIMLMWVVCLWV